MPVDKHVSTQAYMYIYIHACFQATSQYALCCTLEKATDRQTDRQTSPWGYMQVVQLVTCTFQATSQYESGRIVEKVTDRHLVE